MNGREKKRLRNRDGRRQGRQRETHVSPGALAGSMKSLRPKSEFCACPSPPPPACPSGAWLVQASLKQSLQGWPLQLQLTATIWDMNPVLLDLLSLRKARKYVKALVRPNECICGPGPPHWLSGEDTSATEAPQGLSETPPTSLFQAGTRAPGTSLPLGF